MKIGAENVTVAIGGRAIVSGVSVVCAPGTMTALIGPSGSGKTTLLHCLGLLQRPTDGRVLIDGKDTAGWRSRHRQRFWQRHAAFVLQDYGIVEEESVAFNVTMRAAVLGGRDVGDRHRLQAALAATGLAGREREPAARLSGGEKQRLAIARALYKDAEAVFVDEPTASLDDANRAAMIDLLAGLARQGRTVVVATHDADMAAACTTAVALGAGRAATCAATTGATADAERTATPEAAPPEAAAPDAAVSTTTEARP